MYYHVRMYDILSKDQTSELNGSYVFGSHP